METHMSKITFIFVSYILLAGGYVTQLIPHQTHIFLSKNVYAKHILGFITIFLFIMLEGGWSFDQETENSAPIDWSSGNALDTGMFALGVYSIMLLSSKMRLLPNLLFYFILFMLYLLNTQRLYWKNRDKISESQNARFVRVSKALCCVLPVILMYGNY